jgi:hypothetical protein
MDAGTQARKCCGQSGKQASRHQRDISVADGDGRLGRTEPDGRASDGYCEEHARQRASKSSRLRRYLKKIYLLYVMWRAMRQCHYVMGGLLGQQKVSYGWVLGLRGHRVRKQL